MNIPCHIQCTPVADSDDASTQLFAHSVIASLDWIPADDAPLDYFHAKFEEAILNDLAQSPAECQLVTRKVDSSKPLGNP